jgi:tRNA threonylcarbamoyladenosine biosynthesis protein TsaE
MKDTIISHSEKETKDIGFQLAKSFHKGNVIALTGELGAGKTELIKGICSYFKVEEFVTSPTFTIINQYNGEVKSGEIIIYHLDLYRIKNTKELEEIGFSECLADEGSIKLIEWPEKAGEKLAKPDFFINIETDNADENKRIIKIN